MTTNPTATQGAAELHQSYRPHLDAVRGIAIGAVMLFHAENGLFPGGALGVDAFFMLSAYLITTLLCRERGRTGRVDLKSFYLRRAFRLMPALLLFTFLVATPLALLRHESNVGSSVVTTLLYLSDFARAGVAFAPLAEPFGHTWSLAVEEQFYLVWPSVLLLLYSRTGLTVSRWVALGVIGSAVAVQYLSTGWLGVGQTYFLPTGHLIPLAGGCLLALAMRAGPHPALMAVARHRLAIPLGVVGFAALTMLERPFLPSATGPIFAILATVTIGVVIASGEVRERVPAWLQSPVLLWLGQRSYGLYLYHTALILLFAAPLIAVRHAVAVPLWLITSVIVAEVSYRFVERPVLVRGRRWLKATRPPV